MSKKQHLWEIDHPYNCYQGTPDGKQQPCKYASWTDFLEEEGDSDMDYNLVFRWDWRKADPDEELDGNETDQLLIFFMSQRKGAYRWAETKFAMVMSRP